MEASSMEVDPMGLVPLPLTSSSNDQATPIDPSPSQLDTTGLGPFVRVATDKLTVVYTGSGTSSFDVGAVRADRPAPGGRMAYYFEMVVKNSGEKGCVAIGFGHEAYNLRRQPGWDSDSCGYHGDDGHLYHGAGYRKPFGPTFSTGDTVGAGINYASKEFFFTKNGKLVGNVRLDIKVPVYPLVALHSPNEEVYVNFGQQPLLFSFEAFMLEERLKQQASIQKSSLPPKACHWIIRSYLLHYGYQDTLNAFDKDSEQIYHPLIITQDERDIYALDHRKILREHIKRGEIDLVFDKLREWYPQVVKNETSAVCFLLHSQKFIGYIQAGELVEAVDYARIELAKFLNIKFFADLLEDIFGLLAYNDPTTSCTWYQLGMCHPEFVADAVNVMVLSTNPNLKDPKDCAASRLEMLLRQVIVCSSENGDRAVFDLHPELGNGSKREEMVCILSRDKRETDV